MKTKILIAPFSQTVEKITAILPMLSATNDDEAIHELRVNIRTQRVLFSLFSEDKEIFQQVSALKKIAKLTNPIRDIDVGIDLATALFVSTQEGSSVINDLQNAKTDLNLGLFRTMDIPHLIHQQYQLRNLWEDNLQVISYQKLKQLATDKVACFEKQLQMISLMDSAMRTIDEWHQCRILVKKLRYSREGFNCLLAKVRNDYLPTLIKLQKQLGIFHDYCVFRETIENYSAMPILWRYHLGHYETQALNNAAVLLAGFQKGMVISC